MKPRENVSSAHSECPFIALYNYRRNKQPQIRNFFYFRVILLCIKKRRSAVLSSGMKKAERKIIEGTEVGMTRGESKWKIGLVIEWGSKWMRCYFMPIHASAFDCMKSVYTFVTLWAHEVAVIWSLFSAVREVLYLVRAYICLIKGVQPPNTHTQRRHRDQSFLAFFRSGLYLTLMQPYQIPQT